MPARAANSASRVAVTSKALRSKFKMMVLTMISYHDVAFTYDAAFLTARFVECKVRVRACSRADRRRTWCRS